MKLDSVNKEVIELIKANAAKGLSEYGKTMDRTDLSLEEWLIHLRSELLDATVYVTKILQELEDVKALLNGQLKYDEQATVETGHRSFNRKLQ